MRIGTATGELTQQLGRSPTPRELAEALGCTVEEIVEGIESSHAYATLSLDASDDHDDGPPTVLSTLGVDDVNIEHVEVRESIKPLLEGLGEREMRILLLRFCENMSQSQSAVLHRLARSAANVSFSRRCWRLYKPVVLSTADSSFSFCSSTALSVSRRISTCVHSSPS